MEFRWVRLVAPNFSSENFSGTLAWSARVRSVENFLVGPNGYSSSGALSIIQLDSNSESNQINAGSGNPDTVIFTANINGVVTSHEIVWTEEHNIGDLRLPSDLVGF